MKKLLLSLCAVAVTMFFMGKIATAQYNLPITILEVNPTTGPMVMDGDDEGENYGDWVATKIAKEAGAGIDPYLDGDDDFTARFKLCWDNKYLYLIADVTDDAEENYLIGKTESWTWDNVEAFIDLDTNGTTATYSTTSTTQMRFNRGLLDASGADSLVESNGQDPTAVDDYMWYVDQTANFSGGSGWFFEVAIPWQAATDSATYDIMPKSEEEGGTVVGFDMGFADADGDGTGTTGGRNVEGGAQAFWDLDDPVGTGVEDGAYNNRRAFGFIVLTGVPVILTGIDNPSSEPMVGAYPNPANDFVTFTNLQGVRKGAIISLLGQTVKSFDITDSNMTVNVADLHSGVYFFKAENSTRMVKFIVK